MCQTFLMTGDSYSTNQDFTTSNEKLFFFAMKMKMKKLDTQMLKLPHTIDNQNRPQLYDLQRRKKQGKKSIFSDKKCKKLLLISLDKNGKQSLNCVLKVFTSFCDKKCVGW